MIRVEIKGRLSVEDVATVRTLLEAATPADGLPPMDEHRLAEISGTSDGGAAPLEAGRAADVASAPAGTTRDDHDVAARAAEADRAEDDVVTALAMSDRELPLAYAQAIRGGRGWDLALVLAPDGRQETVGLADGADTPSRDASSAVPEAGTPSPGRVTLAGDASGAVMEAGRRVLAAVVDGIAGRGGGRATLWVSRPSERHDAVARAARLHDSRDLWQLRRTLPVGEPWSLQTRPFEPGRDETAWLSVNNRAFDWHPEQGDWTLDDLRRQEREPWFDPEGFLLHERDGRLAGFCWTKVHADHDPPLGEIYVIAVDPDFAGHGLGRELTLAGLDHLARAGLPVGMLYVDATNAQATRLYDRLGFTLHHIDRAYTATIAPR